MTWFGWTLIGMQVLGIVLQTLSIGDERGPITPKSVVVGMFISSLIVAGVLFVGTGSL